MKKLNHSWKDELTERIASLAGKNEAQFAKKAKISDQAFRKYLKGSVPGGENIKKIAEAGNVSTDWLLTGKEKHAGSGFVCGWAEPIQDACKLVHKIMTSDNKFAKEALRTNLAIFEDHEKLSKAQKEKDAAIVALTKKTEILSTTLEDMKTRLEFMEKQASLKLHTDTD